MREMNSLTKNNTTEQNQTNSSQSATKKHTLFYNVNYYEHEHPILNSFYVDYLNSNPNRTTSANRIYSVTLVNNNRYTTNQTDKTNTPTPLSNVNANHYDYNMKFFYNFDTDKANDLNILFRKFSAYEDNIYSYSVVQEKFTKELYMHIKSKNGKFYLNSLTPLSNYENKFYFKFKKTSSLTIRMKSVESWNIIRYEVFMPFPVCNIIMSSPATSTHTDTSQGDKIEAYAPSDYLNCEDFDEKSFFDEIQQRVSSKKYKSIHVTFTNEVRKHHSYDPFKCIFMEYFGKIFS